MKSVFHPAATRGHADHGWLNSYHSFSFASYHNPERMHFGALRVLNDDTVAAGRGFGRHRHDNMEIVSIPLEGDLEHQDSMGNVAVIREGDVQAMSAGTGVFHSEFNKSQEQEVKFLQIWIIPRETDVKPRYDQVSIKTLEEKNIFYQVLSPSPEDQGVWIHQDAWFHLGNFEAETRTSYALKKEGNGLYVFVLSGAVRINSQVLGNRDAMGIWDTNSLDLETLEAGHILLMEVPMVF